MGLRTRFAARVYFPVVTFVVGGYALVQAIVARDRETPGGFAIAIVVFVVFWLVALIMVRATSGTYLRVEGDRLRVRQLGMPVRTMPLTEARLEIDDKDLRVIHASGKTAFTSRRSLFAKSQIQAFADATGLQLNEVGAQTS